MIQIVSFVMSDVLNERVASGSKKDKKKDTFFTRKNSLVPAACFFLFVLSYLEPSSTLERYLLLVQCVGPRMETGKSTRKKGCCNTGTTYTFREHYNFAPSFPTTFFLSS